MAYFSNQPVQPARKLVVLGNGPSLKEFDFSSLMGVDSLGMNAAYRYWERVNWYPTHYVCLDDQLIETHADAIHDLIVTGKVKSAFLIAKILDYHPDLIGRDNVYYLESFNTARQKRVANRGISYIESVPFKESDPSKVTTGAYAVRYGSHLGYEEITILGVDLRYVEMIPEAQQTEGIKLVIQTTPTSNPNYFFDDYQRAGDKFNIPNPASHGRNLHVSAFEVLANDVVQFEWPTQVYNSNRQSVLFDKAIFPFRDIQSFVRKRCLAAVVVPTTRKEEHQILSNLLAWDQPQLAPSVGTPSPSKPDLIFAFSCAEDKELRKRILEAVEHTMYVRRSFDRIEVRFVALSESVDYYERDYSRDIKGKGFKSGPNEQFFELMNSLAGYGEFVFYMEADCAPLRQGWLDRIRMLAEGDNESWIIGSLYRGVEKISDRFFLHLNGNALYRIGDPAFIEFVQECWRPKLYEILETSDKRLAYDCLLSYLFTSAHSSQSNDTWQIFQDVGHRFRATSVIQNISGEADKTIDVGETIRRLMTEDVDTYLVHGMQFTRFLHEQMEKHGVSIGTKIAFSWSLVIGDVPVSNELPRSVWKANHLGLAFPRLLMIDSTPIGHASATGQLKQTFLGDWPKASFLQIWESGGQNSTLHTIEIGQSIDSSQSKPLVISAVIEKCRVFQPDVIYFRPIDSATLFDVAEQVVAEMDKPLVIHMMDDWPERLRVTNIEKYSKLDTALRHLIAQARIHLSISEAMSMAYKARYGVDWIPLANGVDLAEFPAKDWSKRIPVSQVAPFVFRYMGGLADDMTYSSIVDIARAVSLLQVEFPIRFEIHTMEWYRNRAKEELCRLPGVVVRGLVDAKQYGRSLSEADALVIAYNFDPVSINYIGLSLANKMPECLASAVPLLAYGPAEVATIDYLKKARCAQVVDSRDGNLLRNAVMELVTRPEYCRELGEKARMFVAARLAKKHVQRVFSNYIVMAASINSSKWSCEYSAKSLTNKANVAITFRSGGPRYKVLPCSHFTELSSNQWRYTHSDAAQKLWQAVFDEPSSTVGRCYVASMRLKSNKAMKVSVSIGRYGSSEYEGANKNVTLTPGVAQTVLVRKEFTKPHAALKAQVEVLQLEGGGGTADLTIESVSVNETLVSIRRRIPESDLNLRVANRLYREEDYSTSMGLYLLLYQQRALRIYPDNALMAARKLGMDSVQTVEELVQLVQ